MWVCHKIGYTSRIVEALKLLVLVSRWVDIVYYREGLRIAYVLALKADV